VSIQQHFAAAFAKTSNKITALFALILVLFAATALFSPTNQPAFALAQPTATATARPESTQTSLIPLNPAAGSDIGFVYEAYLSPWQEGGEESDTPPFVPAQFRSTAPSVSRSQRTSRGHAVLEFTNDLSRVYVFLAIDNVKADDIVMLHLHCGLPGQLGPILVDFDSMGSLPTYFADGKFSMEIQDQDIVTTANESHGVVAAFTVGCPIVPTIPNDRVKTVAGMETIARQGQLYFNLHTKGQVYFGDIRGQFYLVDQSRWKK
jgi:hypothetical protein